MMKRHLKYLSYVLRHKWFVFIGCCKLGVPWLGIIHDLSKFKPSEFLPYARHFYNSDGTSKQARNKTGYYNPVDTGDAAFDFARFLHLRRNNRHHWHWWILPDEEGIVTVFPMPDKFRREMLADWQGASLVQGYGWDVGPWYQENTGKMRLHPETREWIERQIKIRRRRQ